VDLKHPVVYGHPLHAMLSDFPAALIPTALLAAAAERIRPTGETRFAARSASALAVTAALMAGAVGWWDWLFVPNEHPARRPATIHGLLNTAGLGVGALALFRPRRRLELLIGLNAVLLVAAWIGGDLVYRLGWRVRPAEELEQIEQGKSPAEARAVIDKHEREDLLLSFR
jgi:uncharacterized membrane protein